MPFTHDNFNDQIPHGRLLRQYYNGLDAVNDLGPKILLLVPTMCLNGDASDAANFTEVTARFGFPDNATAKAAFDEFQSVNFKLTTDASVDSVHAAIAQFLAKLR